MALWYHARPRNPNPTGKFLHHRGIGLEHTGSKQHRGWSYQLIQHRTGSTVSRTLYNVAISGAENSAKKKRQAGYLQGFQTAERAGQAAREWIDRELL